MIQEDQNYPKIVMACRDCGIRFNPDPKHANTRQYFRCEECNKKWGILRFLRSFF